MGGNPKSLLSTVEEISGGRAESIADATPTESKRQPTYYRLPSNFVDSGTQTFRVDGPIAVDHVNSSMHPDGIDYHVIWDPLDAQGNVRPSISNRQSGAPMSGTHVPPISTISRTYNPPFDNPDGWRVRIIIPPQPARSGNSDGVYLNIIDPSKPPKGNR